MGKFQILRLVSIAGAVLVGFWLPLRLIGFVPSAGLEMRLDLMISCISVINLIFAFRAGKARLAQALELAVDSGSSRPGLRAAPFPSCPPGSNVLLFVNLLAARHMPRMP